MPKLYHDLANFSTQEQNWAMLISQVAEGNESALGALYDGTSRLVYGLALRILADIAEAEEVTIEVYMQVWRKAGDYNPERSTPSVWLLMLTRSRAIDRVRSATKRSRREESLDIDVPTLGDDPEDAALAVERRQLIQNALAKLTPQQRRAIELAYFSRLSQSEIAVQMRQPIGTVKSLIRFGMIKLRELLGSLKEEEQ
jgi:RNA polymerase sigma-70 factor, ECF subfamily